MKKVILVQRNEPGTDHGTNERKFVELKELARAAHYNVVGVLTQTRYPDRKYQVGRGKVDELAELVEALDAEKVIFNHQLSTTQIYNISETCKCEVIDRFNLILEIFASRATTRRAKLQVELAKLQYELPKARAIVSLLKKDERPGFMGLGGYEDSYEQDVKKRIVRIRNEIHNSCKGGESLRSFRHERGFSLVALAGYTNAGKSTLFQSLVKEGVEVEDMLFTTLSPTTRSLSIKQRRVLLTDTVGFIEDLPHWMVDAFRSTLDEIFLADVILLVVDMSDPLDVIRQKLVVSHDIFWKRTEGAEIVAVLNKADMVDPDDLERKVDAISYLAPHLVLVSASSGDGFEVLLDTIYENLPHWSRSSISLDMSEDSLSIVSWLYDEGIVHSIDYGEYIVLEVEAREEILRKVRKYSI
ncbi:GTPase HflX [Methanococcoides burtonii]|uniref:GTPase HflX n=1 Tax=Methanococcoides burtonii (strain DSM 6242 / NBRC 107633 / OCM 468 / ACE-M) TaxID=259564 RepID=Q12TG4_METBU|nr:GTPase HflX [Methanococcoides burtonii]ABE53262.1 GTP-binding domain protein [Methanococcoides burtonii DSM 6242]